MTLDEVRAILNGVVYTEHSLDSITFNTASAADLLSDVLAFTKERSLLLTGLIHPQVIRTAEMLDLAGVVLVRGKEPSQDMIDLARSMNVPLLSTAYPMYECCGMLNAAGLRGRSIK